MLGRNVVRATCSAPLSSAIRRRTSVSTRRRHASTRRVAVVVTTVLPGSSPPAAASARARRRTRVSGETARIVLYDDHWDSPGLRPGMAPNCSTPWTASAWRAAASSAAIASTRSPRSSDSRASRSAADAWVLRPVSLFRPSWGRVVLLLDLGSERGSAAEERGVVEVEEGVEAGPVVLALEQGGRQTGAQRLPVAEPEVGHGRGRSRGPRPATPAGPRSAARGRRRGGGRGGSWRAVGPPSAARA